MTPLEEKLAQREPLWLERARQEEERKARERLEAEQRAREQELEIELEVLRLEEEEEQKRWEETEKNDGRRQRKNGRRRWRNGRWKFHEKDGVVVGGARGVPEGSGGRERGSRKLQDGGGAPVLELYGTGAGVRPRGVSGC